MQRTHHGLEGSRIQIWWNFFLQDVSSFYTITKKKSLVTSITLIILPSYIKLHTSDRALWALSHGMVHNSLSIAIRNNNYQLRNGIHSKIKTRNHFPLDIQVLKCSDTVNNHIADKEFDSGKVKIFPSYFRIPKLNNSPTAPTPPLPQSYYITSLSYISIFPKENVDLHKNQ